MATTVSEKQTDEVDSNEPAVVSNETRSDSRISHSNHLQNGTDNSSTSLGGSNSVTSVSTKRFDMSQYLQDGNNGPHGGADSKVSSESSEQNISSESGHINDSSAPPLSQNYPPIGISSRSGPFTMDHPTGNTMDSNQYASQSIRHNFPVSKPAMIPPRSPGGVYPQQQQQRFMSGQSISQQAGPTPTLNQLLQTSNTMQRMQNSYGHAGEAMYSLNWSSQTPHGLYSSQSNASPGPTSTQLYRNPSPPFINRPAQPSTPNTNPPDSGELAVGNTNSNDSSSGQGAGTPNSQGMRPTPSPTGSTGSRSMSPAVGQQNIQMPPRPSSSQSDGSGPTRMSHSPMATQGGYQGPPPPPHISGYKIPGGGGPQSHQQGPGTPGTSGPGGPPYSSPQQQSLTQPHSQQYSSPQGYSVRPQSNMQYGPNQVYGPANTGQQSPTTNNMGPAQYSGRPMPNHFPGYPQSWTSSPGLNQGPPSSTNLVGSKGTTVTQSPGPQPTSSLQSTNSQSPRPPHYLKTHLQHKMGFGSSNTGIISSNSPPQGYSGGGPLGPGMGPPGGPGGMHHHPGSSMGPPPMGHMTHGGMSMGPPNMAPPVCSTSNSHEGPMPPPSSTPNSHVPMSMGTPAGENADAHDNGITTTASGTASTHVTPASGGSVTSVVTTGPDGTALDEGSQQSTLSNASAASGEDPQCSTPKSRKNEMGGHYSHPATPQSTVPSPGAASMNSLHADEYDISSPSWPRTPASPVFNSHVPQPDTYRSKKTDSLGKLYEMDDSPERRAWLDKLLAFMEERRTPITTCPTISKNPLDLFRLYIYVKERGGFMEVCKVTKNKTWKDIAGMLGIGASSSAAYTLRKHYTKNLLAYECKFDRGGIDPQPIINQVESTSKKKGAKSASVPSPGSSNSQDSFPTPGSSSASMDGYSGYGYPPGSTPDYNSPPMQRPASQTNAPSPHPGSGVPNHHSQGANVTQTVGGDNISVSNPFDDVTPGQSQRTGAGAPFTPAAAHQPYGSGGPPRPQGIQQGYPGQSGYSQYPGPGSSPDQYQNYPANSAYPPTTRPVGYPPYSPDGDRGTTYNQSGVNSMTTSMASNMATNNPSASTAGSSSDPYNRYNLNPNAQGGTYPPPRQNYPGTATNPNASQPNAQQPMSAAYPAHQDYYRDPNYPASGGPQGAAPGNQIYGNGPHSKTMPPPAAGGGRRHPDFAKDQSQYPPYNPQKPQMYGWPNSQYRGQYTAQGPAAAAGQQWSQGGLPPRGGTPHNTQPGATGPVVGPGPGQWGADQRYPVSSQSSSVGYQPSQQGTQWNPVPTPGVGQSSPLRPAIGARPPFRPDGKPFNLPPPQGLKTTSSGGVTSSSYSQQPLPKREITFPSDSVEATMPVLYRRKRLCRTDVAPLEAWRIMMSLRSGLLAESTWALDILNVLLFDDNSVAYFGLAHMPGLLDVLLEHFQRSLSDMFESPTPDTDKPWYEPPKFEESDVDLGAVTRPVDPSDHTVFLTTSTNYTMTTRKGMQVKTVSAKDDLFIQDNQKDWDVDGDCAGKSMIAEINTDPWQSSTSETISTKHILTCFQAEFGGVPFVRLLKKKENDTNTAEDNIWSENENENNDVNSDSSKDCANVNGDAKVKLKSKNVEKDTSDGNLSDSSNNKNSSVDKCNKRTKTVSEMLTRIKKEPDEELANDGMNIIDIGEKLKTEMDAADSKASGSDVGGSNKSNASSLSMRIGINHNGSLTEEGQDSQDTIKVKTETDLSSAEESSEIPGILKQAAESSLGSQRLKINDQACTLKRRRISNYEDEAYSRDEPSLHLITETQESLGKRCVCISAILRNLTFVPGNEMEFARNATFLSLLGKLLLLHHEHPIRTQKTRNYDREEDADFADSCSSLQGETEWWWDFLTQVRENILVASANIAGHMDLGPYDEDVSRPVLDGLLHWAVCPSAHGQDPFATVGPLSMLSPQRLALEALCKLCVTDNNVDLVIATPPYSRLERLCNVLTKLLCRSEEQVLREFAVNLLHYLAAASSGMARTVALQSPCVSLLVAFIEQAEQSALSIANQHGISALRENPDAMGTSLDMLRRAAHTLLHLARHPDNRPLFLQQEQRLLSLVMSQILDQQVATIIAKVLYQCSRPEQYQNCSTPTSTSQTSYS